MSRRLLSQFIVIIWGFTEEIYHIIRLIDNGTSRSGVNSLMNQSRGIKSRIECDCLLCIIRSICSIAFSRCRVTITIFDSKLFAIRVFE